MTNLIRVRWLVAGVALTAAAGGAAQFGGGDAEQSGKDIYEHVCQGCHMPDAKGAVGAGAYPALAGDPKLAAKLYPVLIVLKGQKAMPGFADMTDAQIAEVANYIRSNFGNHFTDTVTAADVKALRPAAGAGGAFRAG